MSTTAFLSAVFLALALHAAHVWRARARQKRVQKHDGVLFPFCQLRRDIMHFLHENVFAKPGALSRDEYAAMRNLLGALNLTIRHYNRNKTVMFNLRKVEKHLREYRVAAKPDPQTAPDNAEIRAFYTRFRTLLARAFAAYTPLIRSEWALRTFVRAWRIGYALGKLGYKIEIEYVHRHAPKVREDLRRYGAFKSELAPA